MKRIVPVVLVLLVVLGGVCIAQDAGGAKPAPGAGKLTSPDVFEIADVMSPRDSFQYWLDTVTTSGADFTAILKRAQGDRAKGSYTAEELRAERVKRLESSFDFEAFFDASGLAADDPRRIQQKQELVDLFLGDETRRKYAARNIGAITEPQRPDFEKREAFIKLKMTDLVTGNVVCYRVDMKLYVKGLMWRWYKSELVEDKGDDDTGGHVPSVDAHTARIRSMEAEVDTIARDIRDLELRKAGIDTAIAQLRERQTRVQGECAELERQRDPFGKPQSAWKTAYDALRAANWEKFIACHSARVRDGAGDAARARFAESAGKIVGQNIGALSDDPSQPETRATLKVEMTLRYKSKLSTPDEEGSEDAQPEFKLEDERRTVNLKFVKEDGKWLLDEDV